MNPFKVLLTCLFLWTLAPQPARAGDPAPILNELAGRDPAAAGEIADPEERNDRLEKLEALYRLLPGSPGVNSEKAFFNLALIHQLKNEKGKALHYYDRVRNDPVLAARAAYASSRIIRKNKLSSESDRVTRFLGRLARLEFAGKSGKTAAFAFFNSALFAFVVLFFVFRKKHLLAAAGFCLPACLYLAALLFAPAETLKPAVARVVVDNPPVRVGPGDFYREAPAELADGQAVELLSKHKNWIEFEWKGRKLWLRDEHQIH